MKDELARAELPREVSGGIAKVRKRLHSFGTDVFRGNSLYEPAMHLIRNNGKFMRPTLVLMGAQIMGRNTDDFVDIAAAAELLHVSSLIHDDIVDGDRKRRGVDAVHVKYGSETAILAGDALISKAIGLSARYGGEVMRLISDATMDMCAGEVLDYRYQNEKKIPGLAEYERIARLKSASLIAACCSIAAVYVRNRTAAKKLYAFGECAGLAFQMRDDITDFSASGKKRHADMYRPNIVATLMKNSSLSESEAAAKASGLNNKYIDAAVRSIGSIKGSDSAIKYANRIRVR